MKEFLLLLLSGALSAIVAGVLAFFHGLEKGEEGERVRLRVEREKQKALEEQMEYERKSKEKEDQRRRAMVAIEQRLQALEGKVRYLEKQDAGIAKISTLTGGDSHAASPEGSKGQRNEHL